MKYLLLGVILGLLLITWNKLMDKTERTRAASAMWAYGKWILLALALVFALILVAQSGGQVKVL